MKFKNNLTKKIRVGAYLPTDNTYLATIPGLEVDIQSNNVEELRNDSYPQVKLRVWHVNGLTLPILVQPGEIYNMTDDFYVNEKDGRCYLVKAEIESKEEKVDYENVVIYVFYDLRNYNGEVKRTISTSFQNAFSKSSSFSESTSMGTEFSIDGKISGWIGNKTNGEKGGEADISVGFKSKFENSFTQKYENTITRIWSQTIEEEYNLKAGKIYALKSIWRIGFSKGTVKYFNETAQYKIITSSENKLIQPMAFDTESEMDEETLEEYNKQHTLNNILN